ncbi:MAG: hypothetical protein ABI955_10780, partial [Nitrospirota bacterium]
ARAILRGNSARKELPAPGVFPIISGPSENGAASFIPPLQKKLIGRAEPQGRLPRAICAQVFIVISQRIRHTKE